MKRKTQKTISAFITLLLVLLLPVQAFAEEYNIANGDIKVTVNASGEQLVSQPGIADAAPQTGGKTTITGFSTDNIVTITVAAGQTANVTLKDLDIAHSGSTNEAAVSTSGDGDVNIELDGDNWLMSGNTHAGLEKNNAGTLTIGDDSGTVGSLTAIGGDTGAGIGGGQNGDGSNITIAGGTVTANGGSFSAGIALLATRSYGNASAEARRNGATEEQSILYGLASAAMELGTEKLANIALPLSKAYGKGTLDDTIKTVINRLATSDTGRRVLTTIASGLGEGIEEMLQSALEPVLQRAIYDKNALSAYTDPEQRKEFLSNLLYEGLIGFGLGTIAGGGQAIAEGGTQRANTPNIPTASNIDIDALLAQQRDMDNRLMSEIPPETVDKLAVKAKMTYQPDNILMRQLFPEADNVLMRQLFPETGAETDLNALANGDRNGYNNTQGGENFYGIRNGNERDNGTVPRGAEVYSGLYESSPDNAAGGAGGGAEARGEIQRKTETYPGKSVGLGNELSGFGNNADNELGLRGDVLSPAESEALRRSGIDPENVRDVSKSSDYFTQSLKENAASQRFGACVDTDYTAAELEGSNITISGGTVTANGGDSGAGIGGGYFGDGNDITISGGSVTAIGDSAGAGIGNGLQGNGSNVTVSGNSQVRVQGGEAPSGLNCGTGAGIGNGGYNNGGNGAEVEPDVSNLMSPGCVKYYAPGANMNTDAPIRVIFGKAEPHKPEPEPYNAPADSAYKIGETVIINGTAWIVIGIEGDVVELASFNAFSEEQLKDLENLIMNILTAAQLDRLIPDKTSGERVFLANEDIAKKYFNGEAGHITIKADISILD